MVVTDDGCHGSVGGGQLEHRCIAKARELTEQLFTTSPFKERRSDFNVWAILYNEGVNMFNGGDDASALKFFKASKLRTLY